MSEVRADLISDRAGTGPAEFTKQWAAKMFISYPAGAASISASGNVSSLTDYATGDARPNLTNAMADANQSLVMGGDNYNTASVWTSASQAAMITADNSYTYTDGKGTASAFGDLA